MKPERIGDSFALICALVCGLGNIVLKVGLKDIPTELFSFYFFLFAFVISLFMLYKPDVRKSIIHVPGNILGLLGLLSILFAFGIYTFQSSIRLIEPATVSFLSRFEVIVTIVLAYMILKERLKSIEIIGGIIAVLGVLVLKFETTMTISRAATLMILSSFCFGTAEVIVKKYVHQLGTIRFVFYRNLFSIAIFYGLIKYHGQELYVPDTPTLFWAALAAFLLPVLGRATYMEALKRINISRAALISQSTPLFTALLALLILGSIPTSTEWFGGVLIIFGVVIVKLSKKIKPRGIVEQRKA